MVYENIITGVEEEKLLPYEKCLEYGASSLDNAELLAAIIRTGTNGLSSIQLAEKLLENAGNLNGLYGMSVSELMQIKGIGKAKAVQICCILELSRRIAKQKARENQNFSAKLSTDANVFEAIRDDKDSNPTRRIVVGLMQTLFVNHAKKLCRTANGVSYVTEHVLQEEFPCRAITDGESEKYFTEHYSTINISKDDYSGIHEPPKKDEPVVICHTGYMDGYSKGHLAVMDVVKNCIKDGLNVELHFIGSGTIEDKFKQYAADNGIADKVFFLGQQFGYKQVQKALIDADIFLFPTRSEGLPRSLIEAMANGLACVSSPIDGIKELLDPEYLVDYKDIAGMTRVVEDLVKDKQKRMAAAKRNFEKSLEYENSILNERRKSFYSKLKRLSDRK